MGHNLRLLSSHHLAQHGANGQDTDVFSPVVDATKLREKQLSIATRVATAAAAPPPVPASSSLSQTFSASTKNGQPKEQLSLRSPAQLDEHSRSG